nr:uncharacterized protein LOC109157018 [Ipomoea batatas]
MHAALRIGVHNLIVESDSKRTIDILRGGPGVPTQHNNIITRCLGVAKSFHRAKFYHAYREQKRVANKLAKQARNGLTMCAEAPTGLRDKIREDQLGAKFYRRPQHRVLGAGVGVGRGPRRGGRHAAQVDDGAGAVRDHHSRSVLRPEESAHHELNPMKRSHLLELRLVIVEDAGLCHSQRRGCVDHDIQLPELGHGGVHRTFDVGFLRDVAVEVNGGGRVQILAKFLAQLVVGVRKRHLSSMFQEELYNWLPNYICAARYEGNLSFKSNQENNTLITS